MGIQKTLIGVALLALLLAVPAFADEPGAPPAGVALPNGDAPPPPPPPPEILDGGATVIVPPQPGTVTPIYPTDQPGYRTYTPPTVAEFDSTIRSVRARTDPCAPYVRRCPGYAGISVSAFPGLGFGVEFGQWFRRSTCVDWAWEINLNCQDLTDDFNNIHTGQGGKWVGARMGVKASFLPERNSHPVLRAGLAWHVESGDSGNDFDLGDIPNSPGQTNYFGGYVGIGWEWDLFGGCVTTGPEIWGFAGYPEEGDDGAYTATFAWHFLLNF